MALIPRRFTEPSLDQTFLDEAADLGNDRLTYYRRYHDYYSGHQKTVMADRTRRYLQRSGLEFAENFCETVVDVMAERLVVTGFLLENSAAKKDANNQPELENWVDTVVKRNRLDAKQRSLHTTTLVKADGFLVVDWNPVLDLPRFTFNKPDVIKPVYSPDEPDTLVYLVKKWNSATKSLLNPAGRPVVRLNIYYPDRCEKFFKLSSDAEGGKNGGWARWQDPGETSWPTSWKDGDLPLGIPVIHFRHKPMGNPLGCSELHGVIPQQDLLNKQIIDLAEILDYQAWPQRWVAGQITDTVNLKPAPGSYLTLPPDTAAGQFDAAELAPVVATIDATISRLARRSRTPLHLLTGGTPPSGESLKTAESGLVAKVEAAQVDFGQSWEDAIVLAVKLAQAHGKLPVTVDTAMLVAQAQWKNPKTRDELAEAQRAQILKDLGVSERTLLAEMGYDPDEEAENKAQEKSTLDQAAGKLLDSGAAGDMLGGTMMTATGGTA